jgi:hypothetical protein
MAERLIRAILCARSADIPARACQFSNCRQRIPCVGLMGDERTRGLPCLCGRPRRARADHRRGPRISGAAEEYDVRSQHGFVIDPAKHQEVPFPTPYGSPGNSFPCYRRTMAELTTVGKLKKWVAHNLRTLHAAKVESIVGEYSGDGDEGNRGGVSLEPAGAWKNLEEELREEEGELMENAGHELASPAVIPVRLHDILAAQMSAQASSTPPQLHIIPAGEDRFGHSRPWDTARRSSNSRAVKPVAGSLSSSTPIAHGGRTCTIT